MKRFISKMTFIDAIKVTPMNLDKVAKICNGSVRGVMLPAEEQEVEFHNKLHDSSLRVAVGEWLLKGEAEGDFYPCKASVFERRYFEDSLTDEDEESKTTMIEFINNGGAYRSELHADKKGKKSVFSIMPIGELMLIQQELSKEINSKLKVSNGTNN